MAVERALDRIDHKPNTGLVKVKRAVQRSIITIQLNE